MNWNPEQVLKLANDNIPLLLLITLLLMLVQNIFSFFPLLLLITVNISFFGFLYGYLWSWLSSIAGAVVAFLIVRHGLQGFFIKKINQNMIKRIENNGFYYVFLMRIFPLLPTSIINTAVGLSTVKLKGFFYGTILGNMIYLFVLFLIPMGLMSEESDIYLFATIVIVLIAGAVMWRKYIKKKEQAQEL
ncbi:TVP38/TMEM64 family protein [Cohnella sp.]|uniref:TVP38/TMEM64 family protein n=1 Tax=Cohnella sp. TaxID=1883426 RepID=UPI00356B0F2B